MRCAVSVVLWAVSSVWCKRDVAGALEAAVKFTGWYQSSGYA
jgi:hypothetical protein